MTPTPKSKHGEEGTHYACLVHSDGKNGCCACNPNPEGCYWGESTPLPAEPVSPLPAHEESNWWKKYTTLAQKGTYKYVQELYIPAIISHASKLAREKERERMKKNIGMLRQWLNEDRITDTRKLVSNEDIEYWLSLHHP